MKVVSPVGMRACHSGLDGADETGTNEVDHGAGAITGAIDSGSARLKDEWTVSVAMRPTADIAPGNSGMIEAEESAGAEATLE
ncbi:MAG: hypothetical protein WCA97_07645 [Terriglobales bacterium]